MTPIWKSTALAALAFAISTPAAAGGTYAPVARAAAKVKTGDLDLSSAKGQASLAKRMNKAAQSVCAVDSHGQTTERSMESECRAKTIAALKAHFKVGG